MYVYSFLFLFLMFPGQPSSLKRKLTDKLRRRPVILFVGIYFVPQYNCPRLRLQTQVQV